MNKFKTKAGRLTPYALACGYIEKKDNNGVETTLFLDGGYHVKQYDFNNHNRIFWEMFSTLTDARKCFDKA